MDRHDRLLPKTAPTPEPDAVTAGLHHCLCTWHAQTGQEGGAAGTRHVLTKVLWFLVGMSCNHPGWARMCCGNASHGVQSSAGTRQSQVFNQCGDVLHATRDPAQTHPVTPKACLSEAQPLPVYHGHSCTSEPHALVVSSAMGSVANMPGVFRCMFLEN